MIGWVFRAVERLHVRVYLYRLNEQREKLIRQLGNVPDGPLKRPLLSLLGDVEARIKGWKMWLEAEEGLRQEIEQKMREYRLDVAQKMRDRKHPPEDWKFEVPVEEDGFEVKGPFRHPRSRIED